MFILDRIDRGAGGGVERGLGEENCLAQKSSQLLSVGAFFGCRFDFVFHFSINQNNFFRGLEGCLNLVNIGRVS